MGALLNLLPILVLTPARKTWATALPISSAASRYSRRAPTSQAGARTAVVEWLR
jgi:hypothetical protein